MTPVQGSDNVTLNTAGEVLPCALWELARATDDTAGATESATQSRNDQHDEVHRACVPKMADAVSADASSCRLSVARSRTAAGAATLSATEPWVPVTATLTR